ncbi:hypothetical protein [Marinagarivorans cellulosilyticus]|uniref:Uncharacterized protein n=1 Tax=Marinagarivorans cellulosilyticus TaxID=2721545 RepID=A0AAN1WHJ4_9GAMM|nr:hypothetical protein [Marinagarivorans cellulosilyticus]BCD97746.1 hypothetical protein MARGE09_P1947 [Marinagarivorans cellulosilyticus]
MKGVKKDVLFGEIDTRGESCSLEFAGVVSVARRLQPRGFANQINRLLRESGGSVEAIEHTSDPDFYVILDKLSKADIDCIYIGRRTDQNSAVKATLDCSLFLSDGLFRVVPQWCSYKDTRADEIVGGLIEPLFKNELIDIVYIDYGQDEFEKLPDSIEEASRALFSLSGYPKYKKEVL